MILINGMKYACKRCIRGHRSSTCNHRDAELVMIKKKGRPSTQCPHCKELRRAKNTHVACACSNNHKMSLAQLEKACDCVVTGDCDCCTRSKKGQSVSSAVSPMTPSSDFLGSPGTEITDSPVNMRDVPTPVDLGLFDSASVDKMLSNAAKSAEETLHNTVSAPPTEKVKTADHSKALDPNVVAGSQLFDDYLASGTGLNLQEFVGQQSGDDLLASLGLDAAIKSYNEEELLKEEKKLQQAANMYM